MQKIARENIRTQVIVLSIGLVLMGIKFLAWWLTNSNAILTDALESIINVVAALFALYSLYLSAHPRDANHPYGHGKVEFISAGFEGALILMAGMSIIGKSIYNLVYPQEIAQLDLGILLTALAGGVNGLMGWLMVRRGKKTHSVTLRAGGQHLQSDAWSSAGLVVGLAIVYLTGLPLLDNVVAMLFGAIIMVMGYRIVRKSVGGIMDEADFELLEGIATDLKQNRKDDWIDIHNLRVIRYGSTIHIDCHMSLPWYFNARQIHHEVEEVERIVRENCEVPVESFIHVDPCDPPQTCQICQKEDCTVREAKRLDKVTWTLERLLENQRHIHAFRK